MIFQSLKLNRVFISFSLFLLVSCGTTSSKNDWVVVQPYHSPLAGMGGAAILGSVVVPKDKESILASRALVLALQRQHLSVVHPSLGLDGLIPANTEWSTDIAPLDDETLKAYNTKHRALTAGRIYGISYSGLHDTSGNIFRYKISVHLHERGVISNWGAIDDNKYFGGFFIDKLATQISHQLSGEE